MTSSRTLIRNGRVLRLDGTGEAAMQATPADVLIEDGRIAAIGTGLGAVEAEVIDASDCLVMPGLIDAHRHVWQTALRGVCHDDTLKGYMRSIRFLRARVYRPEDMRVGNHVGMLEAINAGITTVFDFSHCINSPDHATAAVHGLHDAGARAVFAYGFNEVPLDRPGFPDPNARFDDMRRIRRELLPDDDALVTMAAAPSDLLICGIDRLRDEIAEARTLRLRISIHANTWEFPEREPEIALLQRQGLLGPDLLFVHTNLSADEEIQMIADSGGSIVSTPETEMQMSMGPSVVGRFRAAGGLPTLGCDIISNNSGDLLVQARLALQTQRMLDNALVLAKHEGAEHVSMTTHEMLRAMTTNAARALGMDDRIGALAPGREADVILVRLDDINTMPMHDPAATLLLHAHPGNVDTVLVRGRALKRNGRLVADLETARRRLLESHAYIVDAIARTRTTLPSGYRGD